MTPYAILFEQDEYSKVMGVTGEEKRKGLLSPAYLLGGFLAVAGIFVVIYLPLAVIFAKDQDGLFTFAVAALGGIIAGCALYYLRLKRGVQEMARLSLRDYKKLCRVVLKDEYMELTGEYARACLYYDEVEKIDCRGDYLTVYFKNSYDPLCLSRYSLKKGDFDTFLSVLRSKTPDGAQKKGGSR